ncbi:MAG: hypothetical protein GY816_09435 [Cytophagales bacterium]|nr:hypothetical protein [Cytophagales bacterium]
MNLRLVGLSLLITLGVATTAQESYTDEELNKYATVMKWVDQEKAGIIEYINSSVKDNEILSGAKYNSISKADKAGDLSSVDATQEEIEEYNKIKEGTNKKKAELSAASKNKIMSEIGAGLYNRLKKALKADENIKARYQAIYDSLESSGEVESEG